MIQRVINSPRARNIIDSLPENNKGVRLLRVFSKSLLLRKRIVKNNRLVFEGVEDASYQRFFESGNGRNEILVKTLFTAVSPGTEKGYYLNLPNFYKSRPYVPGYSGAGVVKAVGKTITGLRKGDRVAGTLKHSSMNVVDSDSVVLVPSKSKSRAAAFSTLGVISFCGIRIAGNLHGRRVAIMGQGILGQLVNQMARLSGAESVIAVALGLSKQEMAEKSGVDEFIALNQRKAPLSSVGVDVVIDSTGSLKGFEDSLMMVKPGGRVVMLGSISSYAEESNWARVMVEKGIEVRGAHVRNLEAEGLTYNEEAERFLRLLAEEKIKLDHLITDVYESEKAPEIYQRLAKGDREMVGVVIDWGG